MQLNTPNAQGSPPMAKNDLAPNGNSTEMGNARLCVCKDPAHLGGKHPKLISGDT